MRNNPRWCAQKLPWKNEVRMTSGWQLTPRLQILQSNLTRLATACRMIEFLFWDQYCKYNIYIGPTFLTLSIKCGIKSHKQAAFLWKAQRESCLITLHTSDEDNADVARILHLYYRWWRGSLPEPNMVVNTSPCCSVIMLFMCILYLLAHSNNKYVFI